MSYFGGFFNTMWVAIVLFLFLWVYSYAKGKLGSPKIAIIFAIILILMTVYSYPELVWFMVALFLLSTFGKDLLGRIDLKTDRW